MRVSIYSSSTHVKFTEDEVRHLFPDFNWTYPLHVELTGSWKKGLTIRPIKPEQYKRTHGFATDPGTRHYTLREEMTLGCIARIAASASAFDADLFSQGRLDVSVEKGDDHVLHVVAASAANTDRRPITYYKKPRVGEQNSAWSKDDIPDADTDQPEPAATEVEAPRRRGRPRAEPALSEAAKRPHLVNSFYTELAGREPEISQPEFGAPTALAPERPARPVRPAPTQVDEGVDVDAIIAQIKSLGAELNTILSTKDDLFVIIKDGKLVLEQEVIETVEL